jgi:type VI secretion system protein ImpM
VPGADLGLPRVPGLYGKLPARGDFVSRRLDADFIGGWDAWLQRAMSESREVLGARWLECFLSAPVWRFAVPAGMFSKAGWVGLILPSVDRVGRYFPLTIAAPVREDSIDVPATLSKALRWLDSINSLALEALAPELDLDAFDRRLAELPMPGDVPVAAAPDDDTVPLGASQASFQVWQLPANITNLGLRASSALWMTRGGETLAPCLAVCGGLMSGAHFCALLDGRWGEHAWTIYCDRDTPGVDLVHGQGKSGEAVPPLAASPSSENETQ